MSPLGKKPLLWGEDTDEQEKAAHRDPKLRSGEFDPFYIPGYTEQLKVNDIAIGDPAVLTDDMKRKYYKRFGKQPGELAYHFQWVRVVSPSGGHSYNADVDATEYYKRGYKAVAGLANEQEFVDRYKEAGVEGFPPAATLVDGKVRQLDVALFVVDGERYRQNQEEQQRYNEWYHGSNQPRPGKRTQLPFEPLDFEEDKHAKSTVDDLPDAFVAGPATTHNQ